MPANTPVVRKLWTLLTPSERRELIVLLFGMVIAMALETLSAALVLPVLSMMTEGGQRRPSPAFTRSCSVARVAWSNRPAGDRKLFHVKGVIIALFPHLPPRAFPGC